ncbi:MAG: TetR/AcrR family transcriptional regulator [Salinivirgaceae bacterium]
MPRTKKQFDEIRNERKAEIIQAALELFASQGYHNTSMQQIATKAKISKGLTYNYFESKDELLKTIIFQIMESVMDQINPNHDTEIDDEEALHFIDSFMNVIIDNPNEWKLYFQIFMQQDVLDIIISDDFMARLSNHQKLFFDYFANREFDDPVVDIMLFSSIYKGFTLQYVYAPHLFTNDVLVRFKQRLTELFLKPRRKEKNPNFKFDESVGYMLT